MMRNGMLSTTSYSKIRTIEGCFLRQVLDDEKIVIFIIVALWYTCQRNSTNHRWRVYSERKASLCSILITPK